MGFNSGFKGLNVTLCTSFSILNQTQKFAAHYLNESFNNTATASRTCKFIQQRKIHTYR